MDEIISRWVLEFLIRQEVNDCTLNNLFTVLPLPLADSNFKQCMLLKTIQSEIRENPISEKILTLMEQIEESHFRDGVRVPEEMKKAYCAVAVNCTVRFVDDEVLYMKAVKRIWKDRVCKMMQAEMSGLVSEELVSWGAEIEEAVWEYSLRRKLLEKSNENDAKEVIRVYIAKAWEDAGPSFLEFLSNCLGDSKVREAFGYHDGVFNDFKPDEQDSHSISGIEEKLMDISSSDKITADTSSEVGITDNKELESDKSVNNTTLQSSNNVTNGLNITDSAASEYKGDQEKGNAPNAPIGNDKSPKNKPADTFQGIRIANGTEELEEADKLISEIAKNKENTDAPNPSVDNNYNPKPKRAQSIMEPNSTARTDKWVDSIDELSEEGSSSEPDQSKLSSLKKRNCCLLNINKSKNISKRRQKKAWSNIEEDTLRTGVQKYGKGNWKLILNMYRDIFEERNEGDLKDKWRNMTK